MQIMIKHNSYYRNFLFLFNLQHLEVLRLQKGELFTIFAKTEETNIR